MKDKIIVSDFNYKARNGGNLMTVNKEANWKEGVWTTPYGIVACTYSEKDQYARIDFVWNGRHHYRSFSGIGRKTNQEITRKALKFVREIVAEVK